jgi:transposase-like protein
MTQMNNPMMQMMGMLRSGRNPSAILQSMATNNPQVRQVMQMMNGKTPEQLRQMANNMAAERGTTVEDIARQLGIQIPSNR